MRAMQDMSVLVTGASSGIGEATARYLAGLGAKVTITARRRDKLEALAGEIGPACRFVVGDVSVQADREAMIAPGISASTAFCPVPSSPNSTPLRA